MCMCVCVCVCSIIAMHPIGIGLTMRQLITSCFAAFSLVQKPTISRPLSNTMLNIGNKRNVLYYHSVMQFKGKLTSIQS
jgi:hypothetical protein